MIAHRLRVLLIEDNPGDANRIEQSLVSERDLSIRVELADRLAAGLKRLTWGDIDGILLDLDLPDSQGLETLRKVQAQAPHVPIIVLTRLDGQALAQGAVREGAQDYLIKGAAHGKEISRTLLHAIERKGAEEALRQSEQRYKKLLQSVTDYLYTVRLQRGIAIETVHGEGCAAVTGYTPEEYAADPFLWYRMVHADDRLEVMKQGATVAHGDEPPPLEHRIYHKDGSLRWIRNTIVVRRDEHGHICSYDGLISNVTERKRVEEALRSSEASHRLLFQRNQAGIIRATLDGRVLDCNDSFVHILGYISAAEVRSCKTSDFYCDVADRHSLLANLLEHRALFNREIRFRRKDGAPIWVLATVSLIEGPADLPITLGTIIDITERKLAMEAVKDSEALYHSLVESIPLHMFRKDLQGRFTFANKRFCDSLRASLSEIIGKTDRDFFPRELAEKYRHDDQKVMASGEVFEDTEKHQGPTGEPHYVAIVKTPVYDSQKRVIGIQGMFWDVTANKWAEEQKVQLRVARAIQQKLLPTAPPQVPGFDFGGASYPAEACSGDYFDYILNADACDIVVGDVSGHGFGPAILAAVTHACLRTLALARIDIDIETILSTANRLLLADTDSENFVTLVLARLKLEGRSLVYSNAGHPAGVVLTGDGAIKKHLSDTGPLLGVFPEGRFPTAPPIALTDGDIVLFFSDGVLDAMSPSGERFGLERTLDLVRSCRTESAQTIADKICLTALAFHGPNPQRDDITAVTIKIGTDPTLNG